MPEPIVPTADPKPIGEPKPEPKVDQKAQHDTMMDAVTFLLEHVGKTAGAPVADKAHDHKLAMRKTRPPVAISVDPKTASLGPNENRQFTATVKDAQNAATTWNILGDPVGSFSGSGLYTAPPVIDHPQKVQLEVASVDDPTKKAQVTVHLHPPEEVAPAGTVEAKPAPVTTAAPQPMASAKP